MSSMRKQAVECVQTFVVRSEDLDGGVFDSMGEGKRLCAWQADHFLGQLTPVISSFHFHASNEPVYVSKSKNNPWSSCPRRENVDVIDWCGLTLTLGGTVIAYCVSHTYTALLSGLLCYRIMGCTLDWGKLAVRLSGILLLQERSSRAFRVVH